MLRSGAPTVALVRVADAEQVERCEALWQEYGDWAVGEYATRFGVTVAADHAGFRAELPSMMGEAGRLYLAELDGRTVGTGALKPLDEGGAEIKRMYVEPAARGVGLSRRVLTRLIADARDIGYRRLTLDTLEFMTEAQALYRSVGFVVAAPYAASETARAGIGEHTVYLELTLD